MNIDIVSIRNAVTLLQSEVLRENEGKDQSLQSKSEVEARFGFRTYWDKQLLVKAEAKTIEQQFQLLWTSRPMPKYNSLVNYYLKFLHGDINFNTLQIMRVNYLDAARNVITPQEKDLLELSGRVGSFRYSVETQD